MKTAQYLSLNGNILPAEAISVHVQAPAFRYGLSVFEGIRAYWDESNEEFYVFRLQDHIERLGQSMKLMNFENPFKPPQHF